MSEKLTLRLDETLIETAKRYAKEHGVSLSKLTENFYKSLRDSKVEKAALSPKIKSFTGIAKKAETVALHDERLKYLLEK